MKIYYMDCGVSGSIVVVSSSKKEAKKLMCTQYNYEESNEIEEYEIKDGFIKTNLGDC